MRLASAWALGPGGVARLQLWTEPENRASQGVAERSGYRREGVLRKYDEIGGRRVDSVNASRSCRRTCPRMPQRSAD